MITFTTIIVLPLLLTAVAFFIIGGYLVNWQHGSRLQDIDYTIVSESFQAAAETVFYSDHNLLLTSSTASGKTECEH